MKITDKNKEVGTQNILQFFISFIPHIHIYRKMGNIKGSHWSSGRWWGENCDLEIKKCFICGKEKGRSDYDRKGGWQHMISELELK